MEIQQTTNYEIKPLHLFWKRGKATLHFNVPQVLYSEGTRGSGKSALLEYFGMNYLSYGCAVFDMFGAADGEALAWLRAPFTEELNVLLLKGENIDVKCEWDTKTVAQLGLNDFSKYDLIISARPLYINKDQEYFSVGQATNLLYSRFSWNRVIFMLVREASSLWHSRIMVSSKQTDAKNEAIYVLRESRHLGLALGLDSLRYMGIDKDVRANMDYLFLKSTGIEGLADELRWLYYFFNPHWFQNMKPHEFVLVSRKGPLGAGWCPYHDWHKREGENILRQLGFKIEYGEVLKEGKDMNTFSTVGDKEHSEIVARYAEGAGGMEKLGEEMNRSSRTIRKHIDRHNKAVERSGFCALCKRTGSANAEKQIGKKT